MAERLFSTLDLVHDQLMLLIAGGTMQVTIALLLVLCCVYQYQRLLASKKKVADIISRKLQARNSVEHKCLKKKVKRLDLNLDAYALHLLYKRNKLTATEVTLACCERSNTVGREFLGAVTEELYDEAHETARMLDAKSEEQRLKDMKKQPLWGIPISIKDCIQQKGTDATCGAAAKCFSPATADGLQVTLLRNAGAILHVRSNVPQLLMMPESENNVWGRSHNPWDVSRTPGGSSGGEAALVASGCSVMGLGSDIGGSIRIPAHYCGCVGFKPTPMRVTGLGSVIPRLGGRSGQAIIKPTVGPITRSVRDCVAMMQALTAPMAFFDAKTGASVCLLSEVDKFLPPLPSWNTTLSTRGPDIEGPLRIGMVLTDDWFEAATVCKRAVQIAGEALKKQGHEVVPYKSKHSTWKMIDIYLKLLAADGNWYSHMRALEDEELYESYKRTQLYTDLPVAFKTPTQFVLNLIGEKRKAHAVGTMKSGGYNVREYWEFIADMNEYCRDVMQEWDDLGFDAIIMPTTGLVATPHGMASDLIFQLSYTFYANLLHWPAGTVPVTTVGAGEDDYDFEMIPANQKDSVAKLAKQAMQGSLGMPAGVQVVTPMWQDELCVYVMGLIEKGVKFDQSCPLIKQNVDAK